jgi:hypothetical protein
VFLQETLRELAGLLDAGSGDENEARGEGHVSSVATGQDGRTSKIG